MEELSGEGGGGDGGVGGGEGGKEGLGLRSAEVVTAAGGLKTSEIYHVVKEVIGFVLYMHQQIPAVFEHLENEFHNLSEECKSLEGSVLVQTELKASSQRKHKLRIREVKQGIKKLEKLINATSNLLSSLQLMINEVPGIQGLSLVLGSSLARPQHVYEIFFSHGDYVSEGLEGCNKSRVAEALSRKVIRALISKGVAGDSYTGPMALFLLVKAPATVNLPLYFLPKRDFRYNKKVVPFKLHIICKIPEQVMGDSHNTSQTDNSTSLLHLTSNDLIWFQCRHTVKGLALKTPLAE